MRTRLTFLAIGTLLLSLLTTTTPANSSTSNLEIFAVLDSKPGEVELTFVSKIAAKSLRSYQITAKPKSGAGLTFTKSYTKKASGYITQKISPLSAEVEYTFTITITTTGRKVIKSSPFNHLVSSTTPTAPLITKVEATDADEAVIFFNPPASDGGSPVYYYTVISNPGLVTVLSPQSGPGSITVTGLTKATTYTFTLTAHNINGSSRAGTSPAPITTLAEKIVRTSPTSSSSSSSNGATLAAPAFTLSSSSQSVIVNNAITTVTNTSTGGAIASYAISPAVPSGLSFSTTTGQLSGTPTSTQSATNYTITATNAAGSATATFTLTVTVGTPAFSLSSTAETRVATTAITGYTIASTGAPITSYSLDGTLPAGLSFNNANGLITGTPTETRTATTYTITGTSASGETATATYRLRVTGDLGDTGPGGGIIYYYLAAGFSCGPDFTNTGSPTGGKCRWLEVAPSGAINSWRTWALDSLKATDVSGVSNESTAYNNQLAIGLGYKNSIAIVNQGNDSTTVAATAARAYAGRSLSDWYLPTTAELNVLCQWQSGVAASVTTQCTSPTLNSPIFGAGSAGFQAGPYWSSSENAASNAWSQDFDDGVQSNINKFNQIRVRVVRSF